MPPRPFKLEEMGKFSVMPHYNRETGLDFAKFPDNGKKCRKMAKLTLLAEL